MSVVKKLLFRSPMQRVSLRRVSCVPLQQVRIPCTLQESFVERPTLTSSAQTTSSPTPPKSGSEAEETGSQTSKSVTVEPDQQEATDQAPLALKPREMVRELDRYIVGQPDAKKSVALALRNRWRRKQLTGPMRDEVIPKNILMIGPTGVGKTEIARRLAKIADAPFIKVEATRYTEVGFHGKDVDTIIVDLVELAIQQAKTKKRLKLREKIGVMVEERILTAMLGDKANKRTREDMRLQLRAGHLDNVEITIEVVRKEPDISVPGLVPAGTVTFQRPPRREERKVTIKESRAILEESEGERALNMEDVTKEAIDSVQQEGIVFIDEIDKICGSKDKYWSGDASSEGVQRDLLPIIEGSTVSTKHGNVQTDHILFIASGAFHSVKPSDMLPELQGRLPVRVQLKPLTEENFYQILTDPEYNLINQQKALIATEGITVKFEDSAVKEIARVAYELNQTIENIGARRLHTVIEKVMEDIGYEASDMEKGSVINITAETVASKMTSLRKKADLQKFIL